MYVFEMYLIDFFFLPVVVQFDQKLFGFQCSSSTASTMDY